MLVDLRYHIWSLIAAFTALALGILIGVGLVANPTQMTDLVRKLEADNRKTREFRSRQLDETTTQLRSLQEFSRPARAALIKSQLRGVRVAIVLDHEFRRDNLPSEIRAVLAQAGAEICSTTTIARSFIDFDPDLGDATTKSLGLVLRPEDDRRTALVEALAQAIAAGHSQVIAVLKSAKLIKCSADSDFRKPAQALLLISGAAAEGQTDLGHIDLPLARQVSEAGVRVVACEREQINFSYADQFKGARITTVDNVDSDPGRVALVYALAGRPGNFGVKSAADQLLPDLMPAEPQ